MGFHKQTFVKVVFSSGLETFKLIVYKHFEGTNPPSDQ